MPAGIINNPVFNQTVAPSGSQAGRIENHSTSNTSNPTGSGSRVYYFKNPANGCDLSLVCADPIFSEFSSTFIAHVPVFEFPEIFMILATGVNGGWYPLVIAETAGASSNSRVRGLSVPILLEYHVCFSSANRWKTLPNTTRTTLVLEWSCLKRPENNERILFERTTNNA